MSQRKSRAPSGSDDDSSGPRIPPVPQGGRGRRSGGDDFGSPKRRRRHSGRGYDMPREKSLPSKVELQLCVFHGAPSHRWRTAPFTFDRRRDDDRELWEEIRHIYRDELQGVWRRIFGFKKLKHIIPIEVQTLHSKSGHIYIVESMNTGNIIHMENKLQEPLQRVRPNEQTMLTPSLYSTRPTVSLYPKPPRTIPTPTHSCTPSIILTAYVPRTIGSTGSQSSKPVTVGSQSGSNFKRDYGRRNLPS